MSKSKHPQHHLLPVISLFIVVIGMAAVVASERAFTAGEVSLVVAIYFVANIVYGHINKELRLTRVLEVAAVSAIIWIAAVQYIT